MNILISLLLISFSVMANDIDLGRTYSNNLILRGESCEQLYKQRHAICSWSGKSFDTKNTCQNDHKRKKKLIVSKCLPRFVKAHANKELHNHGANCWGTVMKMKGLTKMPRFFYSKEFKYWAYESGLCHELKVGEKALPGDVINVYGPEYLFETEVSERDSVGVEFWNAISPERFQDSEKMGTTGFHHLLHSEIYLTDKVSFGKESPNKLDRFQFNKLTELYGRPRGKSECQENQSLSAHYREFSNRPKNLRKSKCRYFTKLFRCQKFDDFLSNKIMSHFDKQILAEVKLIQSYQDKLFSLMVDKGYELSPSEIRGIYELSNRASSYSISELSRVYNQKLTKSLLTLHFFSAKALVKSLRFAGF